MRIYLLLAGIFLAFFLASGTASALSLTWANNTFNYRNCYIVNGTAGTNYQIDVNIANSQINKTNNWGDIRPYRQNATSSSLLYYNISNQSSVSFANITYKLDYWDSGNDEYVCWYYNASGVASASNGTATFIFYDDFQGASIDASKWTVDAEVTTSQATGELNVTKSTSNWAGIIGKTAISMPAIIEFYGKDGGSTGGTNGGNFGLSSTTAFNGDAAVAYVDSGGNSGGVLETLRLGSASSTAILTRTISSYRKIRITVYNSSYADIYTDGTFDKALSTNIPTADMYAVVIDYNYKMQLKKYILARKYLANPPTQGAFAGEESRNYVPTITIFSPANTTYYMTAINQTFKGTDADSATFALKMWDDNVLTYNNAAYANNTNQTYSPTKTGGQHNITVWADDSTGNVVTSTVLYYIWMGLNVSAFDSSTGNAMTNWNVTISNGTSTYTNTSQNNPTLYEWSSIPQGNINVTIDDGSATLYYFKNLTQTTNNNSADTTLLLNLTPKSANPMTLTSSVGWSPSAGTSMTITCTLPEGNATLTKDGVTIANPYAASLAFGSYVFNCSVGETANYRPTATANTLNIISAGFGCTSNSTFAFTKTVSTTANITTLNFSALVTQGIVKGDLSDVYVPAYAAWKNASQCSTCIYVNNTPATSFTVQFGNYIANQSYSSGNHYVNFTENFSTYTQANSYYTINLLDEMTGHALLPPNATTYISLLCSNGVSTFTAANTTMLVPTSDAQLDEIKATVQYSATEIYYRNLFVTVPVETKNIYLADANQKQVAQMILQLNDLTGQFSSSAIHIKKQLEGALVTMTENNFDAENKVIAYLVVGEKYQVYVNNGNQVRNIGFLYVDPVDLTKTITIGDFIALNQSTSELNYSITYSNATNTIYSSIYDPMGEISGTDFYVYNATDSSLLYHAASGNVSAADFTYMVPDATGTNYLARLEVHHDYFGNNTLTFTQMFTLVGSIIPFLFDFPLAGTLPMSWMNLVMSIGVIFSSLVFSGRARDGIIIIGFGLLIFSAWGWWAGSLSVLGIVIVLAILNKMSAKRYIE